jgi:hypothetical protein
MEKIGKTYTLSILKTLLVIVALAGAKFTNDGEQS